MNKAEAGAKAEEKASGEEEKEEEHEIDVQCPICFEILFDPIELPCHGSHIFCRECCSRMATKRQGLKCPLCRKKVGDFSVRKAITSMAVQDAVKDAFPEEFKAFKAKKNNGPVQLCYGNRHLKVGSNRHQWTAFVEVRDGGGERLDPTVFIDFVRFKFKPFFRNVTRRGDRRDGRYGPFEVNRIGCESRREGECRVFCLQDKWKLTSLPPSLPSLLPLGGYFEYEVEIHLNPSCGLGDLKSPIIVEPELCFDGDGEHHYLPIGVDKKTYETAEKSLRHHLAKVKVESRRWR